MWKLKSNPAKTESIMFQLNNRLENQKLNINFDGIQVQHNIAPKYLVVNLDRSLTYKLIWKELPRNYPFEIISSLN